VREADQRASPTASAVLTLLLAWFAAVNGRAPQLSLGPTLPLVTRDLALPSTLAGLVVGLPLVLMGLLALPGGWMVDRVGPGRALALALAAVGAGGAARGLAAGPWSFVLATLVMGAGIAAMQPALPAVARAALPNRPAVATAVYFNGLVLGVFAGAALVPALLRLSGPVGWRGVYWAWGAYGALCAAAWGVYSARSAGGASRGGRSTPQPPPLLRSVAESLRVPGFLATTLVFGCQSAVFYGFVGWFPAELVRNGWTVEQASGPASLIAVGALAAGFGTPALVELVGRRAVFLGAGAVCVAAALGVLFAPTAAAWLWAFLAGFGTTVAFGAALAVPAEVAPPDRVGVVAGTLLTLGYVMSALGPLPMGALLDLTGTTRSAWAYLVTVALILTVAAARVPSRSSRSR
jgi:CP family cyanate transporter-like MFS transporter